ncbi:MAG: UDP-3-O-(3-hydroxymyristoyl)glucosamine N-acyltransferase [Phycisphaerae bacterium]|nr:UDP-3-O-(3-hydroxymyristoyl)glucosamine N-acyltransferase [Phycisphaerae bacterium]
MGDGRIQTVLTRAELAEAIGAHLHGDAGGRLTGVNVMERAGPAEVTFVTSQAHANGAADSKAGAIIVSQKLHNAAVAQLVVGNVDLALIVALRLFAPKLKAMSGIHPTAIIDDGAVVAPGAAIGPGAYVGPHAEIGAHSTIGPGCIIGENVHIGSHSQLDGHVVIYHNCRIGDHCIIQANTTIGSTGFGYTCIDGQHHLIPHNGGVVIEDCVEIGANCCIDRAKFNNTIIGAGTKLDNLIQVAHNVIIGKCCILAGQVGIGGSCVIDDGVMLAGQVGVADHVHICDGVQVGAQAGVTRSVKEKETLWGSPARDLNEQLRSAAMVRRLPQWVGQLKTLAAKVEKLEQQLGGD